jgi:hypothetical protein
MNMNELNETNDLSDDQIDSLLNGGGGEGNRDIPMHEEKPQATAAPAAQPTQEYSFKAHGKDVKAPIDKILQWASMGYEYPQKAAELNKQKAEYDKWKEIETKWAPYKEVDEYATKNPDWWAQTQEQYQQKIAGAQTNPEVAQLRQELQELKQFRDELRSKEQNQRIEQEDKILSTEIESIRKSFSNIDFDSPDDTGKSLEMKVLEHAETMGLDGSKPGHFRAAFRDYYHDHLVGKAREEGKELVAKERQKQSKLGVLGETKQPTKGLKPAENVKNKSYDDLLREAKEEFGIA